MKRGCRDRVARLDTHIPLAVSKSGERRTSASDQSVSDIEPFNGSFRESMLAYWTTWSSGSALIMLVRKDMVLGVTALTEVLANGLEFERSEVLEKCSARVMDWASTCDEEYHCDPGLTSE
jgi:hypothetical protein